MCKMRMNRPYKSSSFYDIINYKRVERFFFFFTVGNVLILSNHCSVNVYYTHPPTVCTL